MNRTLVQYTCTCTGILHTSKLTKTHLIQVHVQYTSSTMHMHYVATHTVHVHVHALIYMYIVYV